jgi:1,4-dihydroxy-2-naphthoate octaprenyltransferase
MQLQINTGHSGKIPFPPDNRDWDVWWRLLRPHTLTASFSPVLIGTALSLPSENFRIDLFIAMFLASILIQSSTNMFNEYYDYKRGLDHERSVGIGGTIVRDGVAPQTVLHIALGFLGTAFLLGLYLCTQTSWWLLPVGLGCAAVGYLYSGGPYPISATPFGELVAGICMGLVIIVISSFIQTGAVISQALLVSIPTSVLIGAILMANNIRDLEDDKNHGRQTLAILLERNKATYCLTGMFAFSYIWVVALVLFGIVSPWAFLSFFSLPKAVQASRGFFRHTSPAALMSAMVATAKTNTLFGLFLATGLLLQYLLYR